MSLERKLRELEEGIEDAAAKGTGGIINRRIRSTDIGGGAVNENKLADEAVTTAKLADGAVTAAKLGVSTLDEISNDIVGGITLVSGGDEVTLGVADGGTGQPTLSINTNGSSAVSTSASGTGTASMPANFFGFLDIVYKGSQYKIPLLLP